MQNSVIRVAFSFLFFNISLFLYFADVTFRGCLSNYSTKARELQGFAANHAEGVGSAPDSPAIRMKKATLSGGSFVSISV